MLGFDRIFRPGFQGKGGGYQAAARASHPQAEMPGIGLNKTPARGKKYQHHIHFLYLFTS